MSKVYQRSSRCYLIDHHSPQKPLVPLGNMSILEYRNFLREANIDSQMIYMKDHWGLCYYPSKIKGSEKHQGVSDDWMQKLSCMLKEEKVEFVAYYCIEYDEGAARRFPEWTVRQADNSPLRRVDEFARWSLCCYETPYRQYCLDQIGEIITQYNPDSLFLDIFGASLCYCPNCLKLYKQKFGEDLPTTQDALQKNKKQIVTFLDDRAEAFLQDIRKVIQSTDPTLALTINFSCHYPEKIRSKLDYQFSEPLVGDNWYSSAYARDTAKGQFPILAPGEASQVYNYKTSNAYVAELSAIAAQGCRVGMYSGSQHIDGTLEHEESRRLGLAYTELKTMEPWLHNREPVQCIGILQSDMSMELGQTSFIADAILRAKITKPHLKAILGAMKVCEACKIPWKIIPENELASILDSNIQVLLLPETYHLSEASIEYIEAFVNKGACVIGQASSGLYDSNGYILKESRMADLYGLKSWKKNTSYSRNQWSAYLKATDKNFISHLHKAKSLLDCTTPPISNFYFEVETKDTCDCLTQFIEPSLLVSDDLWVNWWSPPPGKLSEWPAITSRKISNGHCFYLAFDFFTMSSTEAFNGLPELFSALLSFANRKPNVSLECPNPSLQRCAFFQRDNQLIIHQLSAIALQKNGATADLGSSVLRLDLTTYGYKKNLIAKLVYPTNKSLSFYIEDGTAYITLPNYDLQQICVITIDS